MSVYNFKSKILSDLNRRLTESNKSKVEAESEVFKYIESITTDTLHQIIKNMRVKGETYLYQFWIQLDEDFGDANFLDKFENAFKELYKPFDNVPNMAVLIKVASARYEAYCKATQLPIELDEFICSLLLSALSPGRELGLRLPAYYAPAMQEVRRDPHINQVNDFAALKDLFLKKLADIDKNRSGGSSSALLDMAVNQVSVTLNPEDTVVINAYRVASADTKVKVRDLLRKGECWHFKRTGQCPHGSSCLYSHEPQDSLPRSGKLAGGSSARQTKEKDLKTQPRPSHQETVLKSDDVEQKCSKKNRCRSLDCDDCVRAYEQKKSAAAEEEDQPANNSKRKRFNIKFLSVSDLPHQFDISRMGIASSDHRSMMDSGCGHTVVTQMTADACCTAIAKKTTGCSAKTCSGEVLAVTGAVTYSHSAFPQALVVDGLQQNLKSTGNICFSIYARSVS